MKESERRNKIESKEKLKRIQESRRRRETGKIQKTCRRRYERGPKSKDPRSEKTVNCSPETVTHSAQRVE